LKYIEHLKADKKLAKIIKQPMPKLNVSEDPMLDLIHSIVSQQLSVHVASIIFKRFIDLYGKSGPTAKKILKSPVEKLRSIGLSGQKALYIQNVASFHLENGIHKAELSLMTNDGVITYLTQIKGVGRWTVEMLLMFSLGREDVFAVDDFGIQQAMISVYKLDKLEKKEQKLKMLKLSGKWAPYRTYACLHLWRHKDS